jgi:hypothetical protein
MMLTVDEYMALRRLIDSERESEGATLAQTEKPKKKRSRSARQSDKNLSMAFEEANRLGRKTNGEFRKGWDQSRIASTAQRLRRKM